MHMPESLYLADDLGFGPRQCKSASEDLAALGVIAKLTKP
jgi:hypothetical protein